MLYVDLTVLAFSIVSGCVLSSPVISYRAPVSLSQAFGASIFAVAGFLENCFATSCAGHLLISAMIVQSFATVSWRSVRSWSLFLLVTAANWGSGLTTCSFDLWAIQIATLPADLDRTAAAAEARSFFFTPLIPLSLINWSTNCSARLSMLCCRLDPSAGAACPALAFALACGFGAAFPVPALLTPVCLYQHPPGLSL